MPLWLKLVGVLVVGATPWFAQSVWPLAVTTVVLAGVVLAARLPSRRLVRSMRGLLPVLVVLLAFQWWSHDLAYAVRVVLGIVNAFVAAGILTATTPVTDLLGGVVRSVPWVAGSFSSVRESARARGLDRDPRAVVVPTVVHVVAFARSTGEALAARGLTDPADDDAPGPSGPGASSRSAG